MLRIKQQNWIEKQNGKNLTLALIRALKEDKLTISQYQKAFEHWFICKGYIKTKLGWLKPDTIEEMDLIEKNGKWYVNCQKIEIDVQKGRGKNKHWETKIIHSPEKMNIYLERQQAKNYSFSQLDENKEMIAGVKEIFD